MFELIKLIAIGSGLLVAQVLGTWCKCFLCHSVTATVPKSIRLNRYQENGGGRQLGTLEVLLFFTSISLGEYTIASAWLVFKVAAKWAVWQHVAQIPREKLSSSDRTAHTGDVYLALRERLRLSNHLFGTFINGTLYNIVAAGTGAIIENLILTALPPRLFLLPKGTLWAWFLSVWAIDIILTFSLVFWGQSRFRDG